MSPIEIHDAVIELVQHYLAPGARAIDLGSGQGAFALRLADAGYDVVGIDMTAESSRAHQVRLLACDLDDDFTRELTGERRFDVAIAIETIEHLENPWAFVRRCAAILRPGGLLIVSTPDVDAVRSRVLFLWTGRLRGFSPYETVRPAHLTPIFRWKLRMMLDEAGFAIESEQSVDLGGLGPTWRARLGNLAARVVQPLVRGDSGADGIIVVARKHESQ